MFISYQSLDRSLFFPDSLRPTDPQIIAGFKPLSREVLLERGTIHSFKLRFQVIMIE